MVEPVTREGWFESLEVRCMGNGRGRQPAVVTVTRGLPPAPLAHTSHTFHTCSTSTTTRPLRCWRRQWCAAPSSAVPMTAPLRSCASTHSTSAWPSRCVGIGMDKCGGVSMNAVDLGAVWVPLCKYAPNIGLAFQVCGSVCERVWGHGHVTSAEGIFGTYVHS